MSSISLRQLLLRDLIGYFQGPRRFAARPSKPSGVLDLLFIWQDRARQRHLLAEMNDHMLRDVGLSRADALRESRKPFWRA